ncbi:unnamed protein product, partial [Ascophyllum nodosum]
QARPVYGVRARHLSGGFGNRSRREYTQGCAANARKRKVETRGTRKDKRKGGRTESTVTTPGLRRGNEHTHYLRGSCSSSKYVPTDGNDY